MYTGTEMLYNINKELVMEEKFGQFEYINFPVSFRKVIMKLKSFKVG